MIRGLGRDLGEQDRDRLTVIPSKATEFLGGIGLMIMVALLILLASGIVRGARQQRQSYATLCAQSGDRAAQYDFCKPGAVSDIEALAVMPALLAFGCFLIGGYLLYQVSTHQATYTFDRGRDEVRQNGTILARLSDIRQIAVHRSGKSYALDVEYDDHTQTRLSVYLTAGEANAEAERVAAYAGISAHKHIGLFPE